MVEAYFFSEPAALKRAGAIRASCVDPAHVDVEHFETTDADFLAPPDGNGTWATRNRARHPKHYLKFLCDPKDDGAGSYVETRGGCAALATLDWNTVHKTREYTRFARSLFEDLAAGLDLANPFPGVSHPATANFLTASVLRNL